jgi:hypothetical protein
MSFRERTAWITLITLLVCFGGYYGVTLSGLVEPKSMGAFHLGLIAIIGLVVLQVGLNLLAFMLNPKDARTPRDEREQIIHARSHIIGYYVMMIGMAATLIITHLPVHGGEFFDIIVRTVNAGVFAMVIAALSVAISQIVMYRRGV